MEGHPQCSPIAAVYQVLYRFMEKKKVNGGCHFITALAHVLLRQAQVDSSLVAGWVLTPQGRYFTHSWNQIHGSVFDIAITRPNLHRLEFRQPAVLNGIEVGNDGPLGLAQCKYGVTGPSTFDEITTFVGTGTVGTYAAGLPIFWDLASKLELEAGIKIEGSHLAAKYKDSPWELRG